MPPPILTDEEFIEAWKVHKGAAALSKHTGIPTRNIHARRRSIERRLNIRLEADSPMAKNFEHLHYQTHDHRRLMVVKDGVVIVWSDAHFWPKIRTTAFRALLKLCRDLKPVAVINNGDAFDGASISRWPRIGWDSKPTVIDELQACQERLKEIEVAAKGARRIWPLGNHDARFENRLAQNAPEYERVGGFRLKDHFPNWEPCWACWINDDVVIKHRFKGGIHATHNNTIWSGKTMLTGHLHSLKVTPFDDYNGTRWGVDTGTLADTGGPQFVDYLEGSPTNWRSGFIVLTFVDGKVMWPEVVRVVDEGVVDFRGCLIKVPE